MDIAKLTSKGQLTVPKAVREKLKLESGSKVVFLEVGNDLVVRNADSISKPPVQEAGGFYRLNPESLPALRRLQEAFEGFAEEEGLRTEEDVVEWVKALRRGELE